MLSAIHLGLEVCGLNFAGDNYASEEVQQSVLPVSMSQGEKNGSNVSHVEKEFDFDVDIGSDALLSIAGVVSEDFGPEWGFKFEIQESQSGLCLSQIPFFIISSHSYSLKVIISRF